MTKPQELEYKSISFIVKSVDEVKGIFKGYAASFNKIDLVNDSVDPKAFDKSIAEFKAGIKKVCVNFDHMKSVCLASNLMSMTTDEYGLLVEFQVMEEAKAEYPNVYSWAVDNAKEGKLCMSIGGYVVKSSLGEERYLRWGIGNPVDLIQEFDLDHIAITNYPVDSGAKMLEVKGLRMPKYPIDLADSWDGNAAEKRWREYSNSIEKPSTSYKNGFIYFEDDKTDQFGGYHFLVTDVIDGEPMVNQRAVIAAYQALKGSRRGVKILDDTQKTRALQIIQKLYDKINKARKQEGIDPLPNIEKSMGEDGHININEEISNIDGMVSAIRFLKTHKSQMSNTAAENFVNKLKEMWNKKEVLDNKSSTANNIESETLGNESQCNKSASGIGSAGNKLRYEEIAKFLKK